MEIVGRSHTGKVRENNEDSIGFDLSAGIAVLADGMGGLQAGEIASAVAVEAILDALRACAKRDQRCVEDAIVTANRMILERSTAQPGIAAMGTTVVVWTRVSSGQCFVGHVGDSRAYRLRSGRLKMLTTDHSVVQQMLEDGMLTETEARVSPNRNIITRAVGLEPRVEPDVRSWVHARGDVFLLCSDGLTDMLTEGEIHALLREHIDADGAGDLDTLASGLIDAAILAGGHDNVSVLLIRPSSL